MTQSIHHIAQTGFSDASSYDKHRPTYTAHETDLILNRTNVANRQGLRLVDLAAGTGLFTEALAARPEGYEVIAVEPHDEMRRELEGKGLKGVSVVKGFAQELPIESGSVDGVFATQVCSFFLRCKGLRCAQGLGLSRRFIGISSSHVWI